MLNSKIIAEKISKLVCEREVEKCDWSRSGLYGSMDIDKNAFLCNKLKLCIKKLTVKI